MYFLRLVEVVSNTDHLSCVSYKAWFWVINKIFSAVTGNKRSSKSRFLLKKKVMIFYFVSVGFFFLLNFPLAFQKLFSVSTKPFVWQNDSHTKFTTLGSDALHNGLCCRQFCSREQNQTVLRGRAEESCHTRSLTSYFWLGLSWL